SATPSRRPRAEAFHPARRGARPPVGGAALARPEPRAHRRRCLLSRRRARACLARALLDHRRVPGLRRHRQLCAPPRAAGAAGGARQHGGMGGRRRERHRDRLPRAGAAAERIVSGPGAGARGAHRAVGGLAGIPDEVYEAARVDGASRWTTYRLVTLPLLKPALLVAVVLNVIYVFNSFPIVWTLNDRNPGFGHDTMITYMYKIAFKSA